MSLSQFTPTKYSTLADLANGVIAVTPDAITENYAFNIYANNNKITLGTDSVANNAAFDAFYKSETSFSTGDFKLGGYIIPKIPTYVVGGLLVFLLMKK